MKKARRIAFPFLPFSLGPLGVILVLVGNTHNATFLQWPFLSPLLCLFGHPFVSDFGIAITAGWAVWYFSVYYPEQHKKTILKGYLTRRYNATKEQLLIILLAVLEDVDRNQAEICAKKLQSKQNVICFLKQNNRLDTAIKKLMDNERQLQDILRQLEFFNQEAQYVRNNSYIKDENVHNFLGLLSIVTFKLLRMTPPYDDHDKIDLSRVLADILLREGKNDYFQSIIDAM